jgi:phosphate starvation-inducible membrane PsiE
MERKKKEERIVNINEVKKTDKHNVKKTYLKPKLKFTFLCSLFLFSNFILTSLLLFLLDPGSSGFWLFGSKVHLFLFFSLLSFLFIRFNSSFLLGPGMKYVNL